MFTFLLVLLIIDSIVLIGAVLLQSGKGNGLAASFGGVSSSADSLLGTRQAGNLLTKASWWGGGIFLFLSFVLSLTSTRQRAPKSVLDQAFTQPPAPATAPATPNATAGGVNLTPAAPVGTPAGSPAATTPVTVPAGTPASQAAPGSPTPTKKP